MTDVCVHCRSPLPPDGPPGVCPACLIRLAQGPTETDSGTRFAPRSVGQLQGRIPGVEVIELIGAGGMGAVYRGRQVDLGREVAVKILPDSMSNDPAFLERFRREAQALARLDHPNIVKVFGSGVSDGIGYIIMEFVEGTTLREAMRCKALGPDDALRIVPKICNALAYAHDHGIVHRDIKPENILLGVGGNVKVVDFGLAKITADEPSEWMLTKTGTRLGTLRYMAPEQLDGVSVDHRADIYSLGVVFYEMLTGQVPMGHFSTPSEAAGTDPRIDDVIMRTLRRDPSDRYQRVADLESELESLSTSERDVRTADSMPRPRRPAFRTASTRRPSYPIGRQWISKSTVMGWPVVHVAYGHDPETGQKLVAKGLIAIGDVAVGGIAVGGLSFGLVSIGGMACGLNAFGGLAIGLQFATGGCAVGGLAMGGAAVGALAMGGAALGAIALGGGALGYVGIGGGARGRYQIDRHGRWTPDSFTETAFAEWLCDSSMPVLGSLLASIAILGPLLLVGLLAFIGSMRSRSRHTDSRKTPAFAKAALARSAVAVCILSVLAIVLASGQFILLGQLAQRAQARTIEAKQAAMAEAHYRIEIMRERESGRATAEDEDRTYP